MDELCEVYADAYGAVGDEDIHQKSSAFRERATAALHGINYSLATAYALFSSSGQRLVHSSAAWRWLQPYACRKATRH